MSHRDLVRLVSGILVAVLAPLGAAFVAVGALVDRPRRGSPEAFLYLGGALLAAAVVLALCFAVLSRAAAAERRRRREGTRAAATVVRVRWNPHVRVGSRIGVHLTVRFPGAGTSGGTVTRRMLAQPGGLVEGQTIPVVYDPADPANFEPLPG